MTLLCSAVEAMKPKAKQVDFYSWLVKNRLDDLEMKNKVELKKAINCAHDDFLEVPDREGARRNFVQFILDNCPNKLKSVPTKSMLGREFPFKETLKFIYDKFRSPYLHEARTSFNSPEKKPFVYIRMHRMFPYRGDWITLDLTAFLEWFSEVVKESLCNHLVSKGHQPKTRRAR